MKNITYQELLQFPRDRQGAFVGDAITRMVSMENLPTPLDHTWTFKDRGKTFTIRVWDVQGEPEWYNVQISRVMKSKTSLVILASIYKPNNNIAIDTPQTRYAFGMLEHFFSYLTDTYK